MGSIETLLIIAGIFDTCTLEKKKKKVDQLEYKFTLPTRQYIYPNKLT